MDLNVVYQVLGVLALIVFFYSVVAKRVERSSVSGPMVYVAIGLLLGSHGFGLIGSNFETNDLRFLADLTLALVLFSDAAHSNLSVLKQQLFYPTRMLLIGLPGAILLGFLFAAVMFNNLSLIEAAIIGTMLAATDAALGKAVITNETVPAEIREGLNVESGLNDGLCVPILLILITAATSFHTDVTLTHGLALMGEELGIGLVVGVTIAHVGAKLLVWSGMRGWLSEVWMHLSVGALALASFAIAQTLHGSGYIAAFTGGMWFGHMLHRSTHTLVLATESIAELFAMLTWILFGAAVISQIYGLFTPEIIIYALVSLTLVRMVPIYLSFSGTSVPTTHRLFMGWFGPRGLASIVFAIIVIDAELPGANFIALVVTCTVMLSLLLHGISATSLANKIGQKK